jgi:hypothetical protein
MSLYNRVQNPIAHQGKILPKKSTRIVGDNLKIYLRNSRNETRKASLLISPKTNATRAEERRQNDSPCSCATCCAEYVVYIATPRGIRFTAAFWKRLLFRSQFRNRVVREHIARARQPFRFPAYPYPSSEPSVANTRQGNARALSFGRKIGQSLAALFWSLAPVSFWIYNEGCTKHISPTNSIKHRFLHPETLSFLKIEKSLATLRTRTTL